MHGLISASLQGQRLEGIVNSFVAKQAAQQAAHKIAEQVTKDVFAKERGALTPKKFCK